MNSNINEEVQTIAKQARIASRTLATLATAEKNIALIEMAKAIRASCSQILIANKKDVEQAKLHHDAAFLDRLTLNENSIEAMAKGLEDIAALPDPVGSILATIERPNGLIISRIRVPLGVIGVIYESRPNVTADAAALCLKAGNAVILRGGSESFNSSQAIFVAMQKGLGQTKVPATSIQMLPTSDREAVHALLKQDQYVDVIVPRGGPQLIQMIMANTSIPLFKHLAGLCHTYIHEAADLDMAKTVLLNAKMRRPGICGATEVMLIDEAILHSHLVPIVDSLLAVGCEIRGDDKARAIDKRIKAASRTDFDTEFLSPIIAVKVVPNLQAAINHITMHGTQHTDAIITADEKTAETFLSDVDSAIVMHNASTQFADGGEFGMGAEIGIATGKLHARGPIGVEQLTTFKYQVRGNGQVRSS